jgi:hypothetical protein
MVIWYIFPRFGMLYEEKLCSQSYDRELQRQSYKKFTTSSLVSFENKNIFFYVPTLKTTALVHCNAGVAVLN